MTRPSSLRRFLYRFAVYYCGEMHPHGTREASRACDERPRHRCCAHPAGKGSSQ